MRVLLGIPPYDSREFYPEYASKKVGRGSLIPGATPPLGLLNIAAVLRDAGHELVQPIGRPYVERAVGA